MKKFNLGVKIRRKAIYICFNVFQFANILHRLNTVMGY